MDEELLVRFAPHILLRFDCPHCGKRVKVQYEWVPEVVKIAKEKKE